MKGTSPVDVNAEFFTGDPFGSDMRQIMSHTAATLHQLYLLFIDTDDRPIRVGVPINPDHKQLDNEAT